MSFAFFVSSLAALSEADATLALCHNVLFVQSHYVMLRDELFCIPTGRFLHTGRFSPMYNNYNIIKSNFVQEPYLSLLPYNCAISIIRFRTTNNLLPVNTLRFNGVDREDRICEKCNLNEVASEFHYLFVCPYFLNKRQECLRRTFYILPNNYKYKRLFSSTDKAELLKLKHFIDVINRNMA